MNKLINLINKFGNNRILVIGDIILDKYVFGDITRINPEAPVPVLNITSSEYKLGGAANVANNIVSLGGKCTLIGQVGEDESKKELITQLNEKNIDHFLIEDENYTTILKTRFISKNQQVIRVDKEKLLSISNIFVDKIILFIKNIDFNLIVISDYNKGLITPYLVNNLKELGIKIIVDPKPNNMYLYKGVFALCPNLKEAKEITNETKIELIGKKIIYEYGANLILTRGEEGVSFFDKDTSSHKYFPTEAKEVYDVSGAGDTFIATFSLAISNGANLFESIILGNKAAGLVVKKFGTSTLSSLELKNSFLNNDNKIKKLSELIDIIKDFKNNNHKIVFTNGCFDILHVGHTTLLKKAKEFGDILILGLNTDSSVRNLKGNGRPINSQEDRAEILNNLISVDYIVFFDEDTPLKLIKAIKPDVLVKGDDYTEDQVVGADFVKKFMGEVKLITLVNNKSTTNILKKIKSRKVLVTGGAGFIGSNLALELEKQGYEVTITDNLYSGTMDNLRDFKGDFINWDCSEKIIFDKKFEVIFHLAAITDPRHDDGDEIYRQNVNGFRNVIELAQKDNSKLVYVSTANLYGNGKVPMKEDQKKELISVYGKSKLKMDEMASELYGSMHIVGLRYFNVYGPRESHKGRPASMIYHLYQTMKNNKIPRLFKWGEQIRDHIYVKDVVSASILALNAPCGVYNVGTGAGTSFKEIVRILNKVLGKSLGIEYFDNPYDPVTYQSNTQADMTLSLEKLRFKAKFSCEDGIIDYIKWLIENERN